MADKSVKTQIAERLLTLAEPLRAAGTVRVIERRRTVAATVAVRPALHLVLGDETVLEQDNQGYTIEFDFALTLYTEESRDSEARADEIEAYIQRQIESDHQLSALANSIEYLGDLPFSNDVNAPEGGTLIQYRVQYRRKRGAPEGNY